VIPRDHPDVIARRLEVAPVEGPDKVMAPRARPQAGLGLGLAIVRFVVEAHGGSVRGHSAGPGKGTTFTVDLPVARAAVAGPISGR